MSNEISNEKDLEILQLERRDGMSREEAVDTVVKAIAAGVLETEVFTNESKDSEIELYYKDLKFTFGTMKEVDLFDIPEIFVKNIEEAYDEKKYCHTGYHANEYPKVHLNTLSYEADKALRIMPFAIKPYEETVYYEHHKDNYGWFADILPTDMDIKGAVALDGLMNGSFDDRCKSNNDILKLNVMKALTALRGYGLDAVSTEEGFPYRDNIIQYYKKSGLDLTDKASIVQWTHDNPLKCAYEENRALYEINIEFTNKLESFNGIVLDAPAGPVYMSKSSSMDMIIGRDSSQNVEWSDFIPKLPIRALEDISARMYNDLCETMSLLKMNYQVGNGGLYQYFDNGYHEERMPQSDNDTLHVDLDMQKGAMEELIEFACTIYPNRAKDNELLHKAAEAFQMIDMYEEDQYETVYCDEDEYIYNEETEEEELNPDYFESYEEFFGTEMVVSDSKNFEGRFTDLSNYLDEILELKCQYIVKDFVRTLEKEPEKYAAELNKLKTVLPESAFKNAPKKQKNESLDTVIKNAECRRSIGASDKEAPSITPER